MTKPMIRIHNIETDEVVDREMTAAEFKEYEASQKSFEKTQADIQAKAAQRQAIADRLGLTADELQVLLG
jgi:hypothetical protein